MQGKPWNLYGTFGLRCEPHAWPDAVLSTFCVMIVYASVSPANLSEVCEQGTRSPKASSTAPGTLADAHKRLGEMSMWIEYV